MVSLLELFNNIRMTCNISLLFSCKTQILTVTQKCLGNNLFNLVVGPTVFGSFAAIDNDKSVKDTAEKLKKANIRLMAITGLEEDVGESTTGEE